MSLPAELPVSSEKRSESAPYLAMTSSGSMPLPRDLVILRPWLSRTRPCTYTVSNGFFPITARPNVIMRETQKVMMS